MYLENVKIWQEIVATSHLVLMYNCKKSLWNVYGDKNEQKRDTSIDTWQIKNKNK